MEKIRVQAPAKVNLHLAVGERRPDGFHGLESIFLALAFGDTVQLEMMPGKKMPEIVMEGEETPFEPIPPEENIVFRAISLFGNRTGFTRGIRAIVEKRIPPGGGLGGGSSDAAAALLALNSLAGGPLEAAALAEIGASLGSDVPFFLARTAAAWVSGRGEHVQPVSVPVHALALLHWVLVNPGFSSGTGTAFRLLDEFRDSGAPQARFLPKEALLGALTTHPASWPFFNDFLPAFLDNSGTNGAVYREILAQLVELGADFTGLSGSGSTCFGVFGEEEAARTAEKSLATVWPFVKTTEILKTSLCIKNCLRSE